MNLRSEMRFGLTTILLACLAVILSVPVLADTQSATLPLSFSALASKLAQRKTIGSSPRQVLSLVTSRRRPAEVNAELAASDSPSLTASPAGRALQNILSDPAVETVQVIDLNVPALRAVPNPLSDSRRGPILGLEVVAEERFTKGESPRTGWWARLQSPDGKQSGDALLVWDGHRTSGIIRTETEIMTIRPLTDRLFALTTSKEEASERQVADVSMSAVPAPLEGTQPSSDAPVNCNNPSTPITLDLMVLYSPSAKEKAFSRDFDVEHLIEQAAFLMNATFTNSAINGNVQVVKTAEQTVASETDYETVLQNLVGGTGEFAQVASSRKASKADVVVLVVHNDDATNCGMAATIGATAPNAFAVVNWQCLAEKYSFAHEIGHLAGAWHDPAALPAGTTASPAYAQGFTSTDAKKRFATVMAYRNACSPCGRVWHWSNPEISYQGVPTGTKNNNNACVWRLALRKMSQYGKSLP